MPRKPLPVALLCGVALVCLLTTGTAHQAHAAAGPIGGVGLSFGTDIKRPGLSLNAWKPLTDSIRLGGEVTAFFPQSDDENPGFSLDTYLFTADIGASFIAVNAAPFWLYVSAGLHGDWAYSLAYLDPDDGKADVKESEFGIGGYGGAGVEYDVGFAGFFAEARIVISSSEFSQLLATSGLRFWF